MGNIVKLNTVRRARLQDKAKGVTMCQSGFHKWKPLAGQRFDVKQGRLLTTEHCERCGIERTILT